MTIKNILLGMMICVFSFTLHADIAKAKFYPRNYKAIPGDEMRAHLRQTKNLKWAFCEALTNTVVRTLTEGLRRDNDKTAESKTLSWHADRKTFTFKYKAVIEDGIIVREECVLEAFRMPVLRTLNGKMFSSPDISQKQLSRILYYLKKGNIEIKKVDVCVSKDSEKAEDLLDCLGIEDNSNIYPCSPDETAPQIKIFLN
jgi:hypothetical protein